MKKALVIISMAAGLSAVAIAGEPAKNAAPAPPTVSATTDSKAAAARERITALVKQMNQAVLRTSRPRVKDTVAPESRMQYDSIVVRDIQVEVNGTTATEHHIADVKGAFSGQPFAGTVRSTSKWQFRDGDWQMVSLSVQPVN